MNEDVYGLVFGETYTVKSLFENWPRLHGRIKVLFNLQKRSPEALRCLGSNFRKYFHCVQHEKKPSNLLSSCFVVACGCCPLPMKANENRIQVGMALQRGFAVIVTAEWCCANFKDFIPNNKKEDQPCFQPTSGTGVVGAGIKLKFIFLPNGLGPIRVEV